MSSAHSWLEHREREPGTDIGGIHVGVDGIAMKGQRIADSEVIALWTDLDHEGSLLHLQKLTSALPMGLAVMALTGPEQPIPQLNHIRRRGTSHQNTSSTCGTCPQHRPLVGTSDFRRMRDRGLNQSRQTDPKRIGQSQQSRDTRVDRTLLDIHQHPPAHASYCRELIQRPTPRLTLLPHPRANSAGQGLRTYIHIVQCIIVHYVGSGLSTGDKFQQ